MKKFVQYIIIPVVMIVFFALSADAASHIIAPQDGTYQLLAPLPKIDQFFDPEPQNALGTYLSGMITLIIGISAVLAVVMLVIGGVEYMTSELMSSKEAGRQKMTNAVLGLIIALGAYVLLFTINPNLLNLDILPGGITARYTVDERELIGDALSSDIGSPPTGPVLGCPEGIVRTTSGIHACARIAQKLNNMIAAAAAAGHNITGGGYRDDQEQTRLRIKNCNGDTTNRGAICNPPTALPGYSRHNQGLAFDFGCGGTTINSQTNSCYVWLAGNAGRYDLYNLPSEPWHWSIDGR